MLSFLNVCQGTMALRKKKQKHKRLLQHITSRGSRLLDLRLPLASSSTLKRANPLPPTSPLSSLASSRPGSDVGLDAGRTVPAGCDRNRIRRLPQLHGLLPSLELSSPYPLTQSLAWDQYAVWCGVAPLPFQLSCNRPLGQHKTLRGGKRLVKA